MARFDVFVGILPCLGQWRGNRWAERNGDIRFLCPAFLHSMHLLVKSFDTWVKLMFKIYTVNVKASSDLRTLFVVYLDFSVNLKPLWYNLRNSGKIVCKTSGHSSVSDVRILSPLLLSPKIKAHVCMDVNLRVMICWAPRIAFVCIIHFFRMFVTLQMRRIGKRCFILL